MRLAADSRTNSTGRREVREVGIVEPESFPSPDSIAQNAAHPFRTWFRRAS